MCAPVFLGYFFDVLNQEQSRKSSRDICLFIKVSLVILGFLSVALFYKELNWLAFILSAGVVLLSHVFALASRE